MDNQLAVIIHYIFDLILYQKCRGRILLKKWSKIRRFRVFKKGIFGVGEGENLTGFLVKIRLGWKKD
jgi:hypothetical protein